VRLHVDRCGARLGVEQSLFQRIGDQGIHSDDFCLRSFRKPLEKGSCPCLVSWKKSLSGSDRGRSNPVACYQIRRQSSCDSEADDARSTALGRGLESGGEALALTAVWSRCVLRSFPFKSSFQVISSPLAGVGVSEFGYPN
jgi:hypothetical protein